MDNNTYQAAALDRLEHDLVVAQTHLATMQVEYVHGNVAFIKIQCAEIDVKDCERAIANMNSKGTMS